jgi:hypothetical protein
MVVRHSFALLALGCAAQLLTGCNEPAPRAQVSSDAASSTDRSGRAAASQDSVCRPPGASAASSGLRVDAAELRGQYELTVIAVQGAGRDTMVAGTLHLDHARTSAPSPYSDISYPLAGWSSVDLSALGRVSLAYSPSSDDPALPGVQVSYDPQRGAYRMVFGNAYTTRGVRTDAGVLFRIVEVSPTHLRGEWVDGGRRSPLPRGYFCAERVPTSG